MAKQIIVPERGKIEVVGDNGYSRRDFLGLAGRLGAGILTASVGFGALDGLVGNEENAVYAQGKKTKLKWKDYRNPEKATIDYDSQIHQTLSKEFIEWDMKGFWYPKKCPILEEEPDLPQKIIEIGEELKIDPCVIVSQFIINSQYGKNSPFDITKSPWGYPINKEVSEDKVYMASNGRRLMKFDTWADGIKACWEPLAKNIKLSDALKPQNPKPYCTTATQMQLLDEMLDKKTKPGKEYDIKMWKPLWDAVKKKVK